MTRPSTIDPDDLQAYVDGRLPPGRMEAMRRALDEDPARRAEAERDAALMRRLGEALRHAGTATPDPTTEQLAGQLARAITGRRRRRLATRALAIAAMISVGWAGGHVVDRLLEAPKRLELAAIAHQLFAQSARAGEPATITEEELERALGQALGTTVDVPDLSGIELEIVSGRLIEIYGERLVQVLYQDRAGKRFSIYLTAASDDTPGVEGIEVIEVEGLSAGTWNEYGTQMTLVSGESPAEVIDLAQQIAARVPDRPAIGDRSRL